MEMPLPVGSPLRGGVGQRDAIEITPLQNLRGGGESAIEHGCPGFDEVRHQRKPPWAGTRGRPEFLYVPRAEVLQRAGPRYPVTPRVGVPILEE